MAVTTGGADRILIAVTIALIGHVMAFIAFQLVAPDPQTPVPTVRLELLRATPSEISTPEQQLPAPAPTSGEALLTTEGKSNWEELSSETARPVDNPEAPAETTTEITTTSTSRPTILPTVIPRPSPIERPKPKPLPAPKSSTLQQAQSGAQSNAQATTIARRPARELSGYELGLWTKISDQKQFLAPMGKTGTVLLEVRLFPNGAVERVRVTKSSGDQTLDGQATSAALAASPFPPPPAEFEAQRYRFTVELVFEPE